MEELTLTPVQEQQVIDLWNKDPSNPPSIKDLTVALFGEGFDGRSFESKAIKKFLAGRNLKARTSKDYQAKTDDIEITEAHKQFIQHNVATMNALEMGKIIFANPNLTNLSAEIRAVNNYIKTFNPRVVYSQGPGSDPPDKADYEPPKTFDQALKKVLEYVNYVPDRSKITAQQKKCIETLIGYMHTYRFIAQMNTYETALERKLAEDAFVRATHDKPDLMQEEVDQYIEYANQVVRGFVVQRRQGILEGALESLSGNDPETMKISMGLVEAIGKASTEYHQCKNRELKLLDELKEKRSARISKQVEENASILNLVQAWKTEEARKELMLHAEKEQAAIDKEVNRLSDISELKARLLGLSKDEIRYG